VLVIGCGALGQFGVKTLRLPTGAEIIAADLFPVELVAVAVVLDRTLFRIFVLLLFRGDCPSVATPQSKVGFIIPAALVL
jgi:hypothetical protein